MISVVAPAPCNAPPGQFQFDPLDAVGGQYADALTRSSCVSNSLVLVGLGSLDDDSAVV